MKFKTSFLLLLLAYSAAAQNSVSGKIIDSLTREPVPFANVYFAGTTIGTTTTEDGRFNLSAFPSGKYDLTASFVGYHPAQRALIFENNHHDITLVLYEKATQLDEVVIKPNSRTRVYDMQTFKNGFLGSAKNTASTKIKNEDDLDFDFENQKFSAFSRKPLEIVNQALGYKVIYDLQLFEINYETRQMTYLGIPRFENLEDKIKPRWKRERNRAYYGSMQHFVSLLKKGNMGDDFDVYEFFRKPNPERPSSEILKEKIKYWRHNQLSESGMIRKGQARDSLNHYISLQKFPEFIDVLGKKITDVNILMNAEHNMITYTGMLYIIYKKEPEEENYALEERRPAVSNQTSIFHILNPVKIYDNGYYEDIRSIFFEGYLGWSGRMPELLPQDYIPEP